MKKIIALLLLLTMVLTVFVSCKQDPVEPEGTSEEVTTGNNEDTTTTGEEDSEETSAEATGLDKAKEYVETMYKEDAKETPKDYKVLASCMIDDAKFTITWAVEVDEANKAYVSVGETDDKNQTTIVIVRENAEDVAYKLVGTIKGEGEETATVKFDKVILAKPTVVPSVVEEPKADTAYKLFLTQDKLAKTLYFKGEMDGFYFATTEDYTEAVDVYLEAVEGGYKLYFKNGDTKTYVSVVRAEGTDGKLHNNVVLDAEAPSVWTYNAEHKTLVTVIKVDDVDTTFYLGTYSNYDTFSASTIDKAATSYVGHLAVMVDTASIPAADKVAAEKEALNVATEMGESLTLPAAGVVYTDVAITWAVAGPEGCDAAIADGVLTVTRTSTVQTLKLTATLKSGDVTDTKEFEVSVNAVIANITIAEVFASEDGAEVKFSGVVVSIDYPWSDESSNMTVYVSDGKDSIKCYKLATKVELLDVITVTGTYNLKYTNVNEGATAEKTGTHEHAYSTLSAKCDGCGMVVEHTCADADGDKKCDACGVDYDPSSNKTTLSFADVENRVSQDGNSQVWKSGNVTFTNNKGASTNDVIDSKDPVRCYASSDIIVACEGMVKVVFYVDSGKKADPISGATVEGATITVDDTGYVVTYEFATAVDTFTITKLSAQVRIDSIEVYTA